MPGKGIYARASTKKAPGKHDRNHCRAQFVLITYRDINDSCL